MMAPNFTLMVLQNSAQVVHNLYVVLVDLVLFIGNLHMMIGKFTIMAQNFTIMMLANLVLVVHNLYVVLAHVVPVVGNLGVVVIIPIVRNL
jgi:hypothetical protein